MLEVYDNLSNSLLDDKAITEGWQAYKTVNRAFRDKVRLKDMVLGPLVANVGYRVLAGGVRAPL